MIIELKKAAQWNDEKERMAKAAKAVEYYDYQQDKYLEAKIDERYKTENKDIQAYRFTAPITRSLINQLAVTFKESPTIEIDGSETQMQAFAELIDECGMMRMLNMADKYAELLHKVGLIPIWTGKKVTLLLLTPDVTIVNTDRYGDITELRYWIGESQQFNQVKPFNVWAVWTPESYYEVQMNDVGMDVQKVPGSEVPNPYGRIPVAWFSTEESISTFWPEMGYPIIELNENINLKVTNLDIALDYQSFSTMVTIGLDDISVLPVGVTRRINVTRAKLGGQADGDVKYVTPDAKLEAVWKIIQSQIQWFAALMGLTTDSIGSEGHRFNSGFQLKLAKQGVIDRNNTKKALYMNAVREATKLVMECSQNYGRLSFPPNPNITVLYADIQVETDPIQERQMDAIDIANGIEDAFTVLKRRYPDMSDEDAEAYLAAIAERKRKASAYQPPEIEL